MADNESNSETRESPENPKKSNAVQPPKRDRNPKVYKTESKENEPPRRNAMCQMSLTSKQDGASTSGCTSRFDGNITKVDSSESDDDDEVPISSKLFFKPLQTINKILQRQKELEDKKIREVNVKLGALMAKIKAFKDLGIPVLWETLDPPTMKNCKHLTLDQIEESFKKHKDRLWKIFNGEVYHRRHEAYHVGPQIGINLNAPVGLSLFEYKQLQFIASIIIETFDLENDPKMWKYFIQVLAPELCLLVFMDAHNMTRDEAVGYLAPFLPEWM